MAAEFSEVQGFLANIPPFNSLPEVTRQYAAKQIEICYHRRDSQILIDEGKNRSLHIVRSGVVEIYGSQGELFNRLPEGKLFGQTALLKNNPVHFAAKALEDCLIYCLPEIIFIDFCKRFEQFASYVEADNSTRLHHAIATERRRNALVSARVKNLLQREPVKVKPTTTIADAAKIMEEKNVSAMLIASTQISDRTSRFMGIVTERDFCTRAVAAGLPPSAPVTEVMSANVITLDHNAYVFEAMLTMLRHNAHHLPVMRNNNPLGIIELNDIVRYQSQHSLLLVSSIFQQNTIKELHHLSGHIKDCFNRMVKEGANAQVVGTAMAVIGRSYMQRMLDLAEKRLGPPPVPYCLLTPGSMARNEQLVATGQNNALILDDSYIAKKHGPYFEAFAKYICDGLAACGYGYNSSKIMVTNPLWRKPLSEWKACLAHWIDQPLLEALRKKAIFFDLDGVGGKTEWLDDLKAFVVDRASKNKQFLACLASNALNRTPPLGFFRNLVLEKDGELHRTVNLKRRGTAPMVNLIRVHALAAGSSAQNSFERLDDILAAEILSEQTVADLRNAMEFISMVRIRHQTLDISAGQLPNNSIEPGNLSDSERRILKDAFHVLRDAQNFLNSKYHAKTPTSV